VQSTGPATTASSHPPLPLLSPRAAEKRPRRNHDGDVDLEAQLPQPTYAHDLFVQPPPVAHTALPQIPSPEPASRRRSFLNTLFPRQQQSPRGGRPGPSRVLNPINYVPRPTPVALSRPLPTSASYPEASGSREVHTLLTLPERRRSRQPSPTSLSFVEHSPIEGTESNRTSIGLPANARRSQGVDSPRSDDMADGDKNAAGADKPPKSADANRDLEANLPTSHSRLGQTYGMSPEDAPAAPPKRTQSLRQPLSLTSLHSASHAHSPGDRSPTSRNGPVNDVDVAEELAWGPAHPCFPHLNPHVPQSSAEYEATRIIRIKRDWMVRGDLAPTYSNLYPEILDPLLPEAEFRVIIHHINKTLVEAFDPYSLRNLLDGFMGLVTGWLWDDVGLGGVKGRLRGLEAWIDEWNRRNGMRDGIKVIPLRRTGYMNLDIQIPDPQLKVVGEEDGRSRVGTAAEPEAGPKDGESVA